MGGLRGINTEGCAFGGLFGHPPQPEGSASSRTTSHLWQAKGANKRFTVIFAALRSFFSPQMGCGRALGGRPLGVGWVPQLFRRRRLLPC